MILFSPIGTADPITALGDGPMLHIVRHYQPSAVTLFLSPAVAAFEHTDSRYTEAIRRLAPTTTVRIVETPQTQVHRFDLFVPEFRALLETLAAEFPDEQILLNTSSGTPAMQAALVAINAFGIPTTTAIQVSTPTNTMSTPGDREPPTDYDLDLMWEANEDNQPGSTNRCLTAASAALGTMLERQNLKQLITSYDYASAATIANQAHLPQATRDLITGVTRRAGLDHDTAQRLLKGTKFAYRADPAAEYVAKLDLLRRRKQWADFARAVTPAIDAVLKSALARQLPETRYLTGHGQLDHKKLARDPEISGILNAPPTKKYLYTRDQLNLLARFAPECYVSLKPLGDFANGVRNTAAHEMVAINAEKLKQDGGLTAQQLLEILARETTADLTIYERMNSEIIRHIDAAPLG